MMNNFSLNSLGLNINKKKLENVETFLNSKKESLMNALGPNPLTTAVGIKIDNIISPEVTSDDWAKYLEICDLVNITAEGPKDATRAIRKKLLLYAGKYNHSIDLLLNLLDCCIKNCGHRFHILVSQKEFVHDLIKILNPKYHLTIPQQEKVLNLIQSWAKAFEKYPDLQGIVQVNSELKSKGIEAPITMTTFDDTNKIDSFINRDFNNCEVPIITPPLSTSNCSLPVVQSETISQKVDSGRVSFTETNANKVRKELEVVQTNSQLLNDILTEKLGSKNYPSWDLEELTLIHKLNSICHEMQDRIKDLLVRITDEQLLAHILLINDRLNEVFKKYHNFGDLVQSYPLNHIYNDSSTPVERADLKVNNDASQIPSFLKFGNGKVDLPTSSESIALTLNPYVTNELESSNKTEVSKEEPLLINFEDSGAIESGSSTDLNLEQMDPFAIQKSNNSADNGKPSVVSTVSNTLFESDFEKIMNGK